MLGRALAVANLSVRHSFSVCLPLFLSDVWIVTKRNNRLSIQ